MGHSVSLFIRYTDVFIAGAAVMVLEIVGTRSLAPVYGGSLMVWATQIGVTLGSLAVGYFLGGLAADRWPEGKGLHPTLAVAGGSCVLVPLYSEFITKSFLPLGLEAGVLASSTVLFFPPLALLGAIGPQAVRWGQEGKAMGQVVGRIFAVSTLGSLLGTAACVFYLIPDLGLSATYFYVGALLFILGTIGMFGVTRGWLSFFILPFVFWAAHNTSYRPRPGFQIMEQAQTFHGYLEVIENDQRRLLLVDSIIQSGIDRSSGLSIFGYTHAMDALISSYAPHAKKALAIGLGAGILPRALAARGLSVKAIELNPHIPGMARRWFDLPNDIEVIVGDGRTVMDNMEPGWDAILLDAYSGDVPPYYLLSREAFQSYWDHLADGGILVMNLLGSLRGPSARIPEAVGATLSKIFDDVWFHGGTLSWRRSYGNILYVALKGRGEFRAKVISPAPPGVKNELDRYLLGRVSGHRPGPQLTDDWNPLELWDASFRRKMRFDTLRYLEPSSPRG